MSHKMEKQFAEMTRELNVDARPSDEHRRKLWSRMQEVFTKTSGRAAGPPSDGEPFAKRRRGLRLRRTAIAVAACILIVIGLCVLLDITHVGFASTSFADVLENVRSASTVSYKVTFYSNGEPVYSMQVMIMGPDYIRCVMEDGKVQIMDLHQGKLLTIGSTGQKAILRDMREHLARGEYDPLATLRNAHKSDGQFVGQEELDGYLTDVFVVARKDRTVTVWVDPETDLPVLLEAVSSGGDETPAPSETPKAILSDFVWDADLDESLFSVVPPPGCVLIQKDLGEPREEDLIDALRLVAELSDDTFPSAFTEAAVTYAVYKHLLKEGLVVRAPQAGGIVATRGEVPGPLMKLFLQVRDRGLNFVRWVTDEGGEWFYCGKDVKLGDAEAPVCWWRELGSTTYRVVYGDLSVSDVYADELPELPATPPEGPPED